MLTLRFGLVDVWGADGPMEGELRELTLALVPPVVVIVAVDIGAIFNPQPGKLCPMACARTDTRSRRRWTPRKGSENRSAGRVIKDETVRIENVGLVGVPYG